MRSILPLFSRRTGVPVMIYLVLGMLLFILAAYKAFTIGITHDEAYSFWLVKTLSINQMGGTANNHWLNSIGIFLFTHLFGSDSEGVMRLQSLIGFIIYGAALLSFVRHIDKAALQVLFLSIFLLNPYVLDFFSLARGYGLSMGLQMMGFYYAYKAFKSRDKRDVLKVFTWMTFALAANYSTLYIYLAFSGVYFLTLIQHRHGKADRVVWLTIALQFLAIATAVTNLLIIRHFGDLEFGARNSFVEDTLASLVLSSAYGSISKPVALGVAIVLYVILVIPSLVLTFKVITKKSNMEWLHFLAVVNLIVLAIIETLHFLFGTPYLIERTALVLYPLLGLTVCFYLHALAERFVTKRMFLHVTAVSMAILLGFNFLSNISYKYFYDWKNHQDTYDKLETMLQDIQVRGKLPSETAVYTSYSMGVYLNYYHFLHPVRYSFPLVPYSSQNIVPTPADLPRVLREAEYAIIIYPDDMPTLKAVKRNYTVVKDYPETRSMLIRFE